MVVKEFLPIVVPAQAHTLELDLLEGVHRDGANEGDVDAEAAVYARAAEADEDAKLGARPLRRGSIAVAAEVVAGFFLDGEELYSPRGT